MNSRRASAGASAVQRRAAEPTRACPRAAGARVCAKKRCTTSGERVLELGCDAQAGGGDRCARAARAIEPLQVPDSR